MSTKTGQVLTIGGMSCQGCIAAVRAALEAVPGVSVVEVGIGSARIEATAPDASERALIALRDAGFDARREAAGGCCCSSAKPGSVGCGGKGSGR